MKRVLLTVGGTIAVVIICILLAIHFLTPSNTPATDESASPDVRATQSGDVGDVSPAPEDDNPIKAYDNGIACFMYDSRKVFFDEMPSDNIDGIPQTWFFMADSNSAMPSVAAFPIPLENPFTSEVTNEDWENLAKFYIMSFFSPDVQDLVSVNMSDTVVKINGDTAKMYVAFDCDVASSPENNMNGVVRLVSNASNAVVTVAITEDGQSLPEALQDTYMSVTLN